MGSCSDLSTSVAGGCPIFWSDRPSPGARRCWRWRPLWTVRRIGCSGRSRSGLGFGDVKLAGVLGLPLGWLGWPAVLLGLALPHLLAGPVALFLLLTGRAKRGTGLPFGPALLAGALLAIAITAR
jgi:prepilin signal peptidase PulO-like enzyme (type II secretory pathway)